MKLTKPQMKTLLTALEDAVSDRVSFLDSLTTSNNKIMKGYESLAKKTRKLIKKYDELRRQIEQELKLKELLSESLKTLKLS